MGDSGEGAVDGAVDGPVDTPAEPTNPTNTTIPVILESDSGKYIPIYVLTGVFGAIFAFGPLLVRKGPNRQLIRACIMMAAFCMYIFWVTAYISQMNPLTGPRLHNTTIAWYQYKFGKTVAKPKKDDKTVLMFELDSIDGIDEGDEEPAREPSSQEAESPKHELNERKSNRGGSKGTNVRFPPQ